MTGLITLRPAPHQTVVPASSNVGAGDAVVLRVPVRGDHSS
ncbi:hypothetical protein [Nocardioides sp. KR10-350]